MHSPLAGVRVAVALGEEVGDAITALDADGVGVAELLVVTAGIGVLSATG